MVLVKSVSLFAKHSLKCLLKVFVETTPELLSVLVYQPYAVIVYISLLIKRRLCEHPDEQIMRIFKAVFTKGHVFFCKEKRKTPATIWPFCSRKTKKRQKRLNLGDLDLAICFSFFLFYRFHLS